MTSLKMTLVDGLQRIQRRLSFDDWADYPQFATKEGIGRTGLLGGLLGLVWGLHFGPWVFLSLHLVGVLSLPPELASWISSERVQMLWQWCTYALALTTFHLLEFFCTAVYTASATADSFLVNHSIAYTGAALVSWTEFSLRFALAPGWNSAWLSLLGLVLVIPAQTLRSLAMATAGESFNHVIQISRKDNHVLITHGIYSYLRHPSYVGFFYWSVATQALLSNFVTCLGFSIVSWNFFSRRIPYEEDSLCHHFPNEYPAYVARTWMGIPFLKSRVRLKNQ